MILPAISHAHLTQPVLPDPMLVKAKELEAAFIAEMLAHTGLGEAEGPFSGGAGEGQFASFLRQEQASRIVQAGGIGLAEVIFQTLLERADDTGA